MPVEEAKKKHKLFPFHIIRKRSKGKSKSLADLSGRGGEDSLRTTQSVRLPKQASLMTCSFETDDSSELDKDGSKIEKDSLDKTSEQNLEENCNSEDSEEEEDNKQEVSSHNVDVMEDQNDDEIDGETVDGEAQSTPEFPQGTTVSDALLFILII